MNKYDRLWLRTCRIVVAIGTGLAFFAFSLTTTITLWCFATAIGAMAAYTFHGTKTSTSSSPRPLFRGRALYALAGGFVVIAIAGYAAVLQSLFWLLLIPMLLGSPWSLKLLLQRTAPSEHPVSPRLGASSTGHSVSTRRRAPSADAPSDLPADPVQAAVFAPSLRGLADPDLCRAWRGSYQWLEGASSLALNAYIVALRQAYLDELERRDPAGLRAWLASAPRSRSGPERYFHPGTDSHHISG